MEVIQGKPRDKKIVLAQEIAFAKVLAGNNKTLRDRALKKLKKWLTIRGNGKWEFTEEEFLRIWTGLFYCMWMSDKFLIQEELAESISSLIHCFKKPESALLFIKCFNKRIIMDWEGLDQYRIDKFNMLVRRFLRQTFVYMKEQDWEESLLHKLMGIFFNVVLHRDNSLGFVLHFISIYNEELAKVSKGQISPSTVLTLVEPFARLLARTKDARIIKETEDFFIYLMRQTDTGIEYEERFQAWREQGFPGEGPHCMGSKDITNNMSDDEEELKEDDDEDDENQDKPLDPRAGSVHVFLPQIPVDVEGFINLFKKHQNSRLSTKKGRKRLKCLTQKYSSLKRGKFPEKIKKDPVLEEKLKKKKLPLKSAKKLLEFTEQLKEEPIKSKEFYKLSKELEEQDDSDAEDNEEEELSEKEELKESEIEEQVVKKTKKRKKKLKKNNDSMKEQTKTSTKKVKISKESLQEVKENHNENGEVQKKKKKKKKNKKLLAEKKKSEENPDEEIVKTKKTHKINGVMNGLVEEKTVKKIERKRKILSNWQVKELDTSSPEYYKIKTPKIIRLEKKLDVDSDCCCEENDTENVEEEPLKEKKLENGKTSNEVVIPQFWQKAKQKVEKKNKNKSKLFLNPFAKLQNESKSPGRRISFALDKNMAQENDQYLEEVKNSPRVPFDGSKKPVQSALKSGLAPSPVNPFYNFKKIKF